MSVNLDGVKETIRALRKFDPELLKEMNKEIKGVMIPIRDKARGYAPSAAPGGLYNWDETAGRKNPGGDPKSRSNNPGAGANFISRMGPLYGQGASRGRMIFRAWAEDQGRAQAAVVRAIENAIGAFNQGRYDKAA